jgi:hypothetical protein
VYSGKHFTRTRTLHITDIADNEYSCTFAEEALHTGTFLLQEFTITVEMLLIGFFITILIGSSRNLYVVCVNGDILYVYKSENNLLPILLFFHKVVKLLL